MPKGAVIEEIVHADLNEDGREEAYIAATITGRQAAPLAGARIAIVVAPDRGGRLAVVLQRDVVGEGWLPIQIGRPTEGLPLVAIFAAQGGSGGYLGYVVVQYVHGILQAAIKRDGVFSGRIRLVPEGLLETRGDLDRIYRWTRQGWEVEELDRQYVPSLLPETRIIEYRVDPTRGPIVNGPLTLRLRVGQRVFLRRINRGEPSRILVSDGGTSFSIGSDGVISLLRPGVVEIYIEGPAYGDRSATILLRIE